jgi:hypothetical protein
MTDELLTFKEMETIIRTLRFKIAHATYDTKKEEEYFNNAKVIKLLKRGE